MASHIWPNDGKMNAMPREIVKLYAELPFTTGGAVGTLTAAKNMGIKGACLAVASGKIYNVCFNDTYNSFLNATGHFFGQHPTAGNFCVIGDGVSGGIATVTMASAANTDYVTISIPGGSSYKMTALTNGGTPDSMQWVVGTGGSADTDSATALANLINGKADGSTCGASTLPSGFSARSVGATVIIMTTIPGCKILSHSQTKEIVVTTAANTVDVYATMQPGITIETLVGVTATAPASGDALKLNITLQNSQA